MKNYMEIYKRIELNAKQIKKLEKEKDAKKYCIKKRKSELRDYIKSGPCNEVVILNMQNDIDVLEIEQTEISAKIKELTAKNKLYKHNMIVAAYHDFNPVFCEVWNSYKGKRLGEKTKEKINAELSARTHFKVFRSSSYSADFTAYYYDPGVYTFNFLKFDFGCKYIEGEKAEMLIDNVIQEVTEDQLGLFFMRKDYIENVNKEYRMLVNKHYKIKELSKQLYSLVSDFNSHTVDGIKAIDYPHHIYDNDFYL